ncbi:MAG: hypothetical protein VX833_04690 [Actinomycetota bacterium]|nr:hypothetical protein [Actinomycetota bacterium]
MPPFDNSTFAYPVPEPILTAFDDVWTGLGQPGDWWSGAERIAIAGVARRAESRSHGEQIPTLAELDSTPNPVISPLATEIAHRVTAEPGRITPEWGHEAVRLLGPGRYAELVAVIVLLVPVDRMCTLLGRPLEELPTPEDGVPSERIPSGLGDGGAFVPWAVDGWVGPNVARALSYVPGDNRRRMELVSAMYADSDEFVSLMWDHRSLSRPQVELLAARTSSLNECFY